MRSQAKCVIGYDPRNSLTTRIWEEDSNGILFYYGDGMKFGTLRRFSTTHEFLIASDPLTEFHADKSSRRQQ